MNRNNLPACSTLSKVLKYKIISFIIHKRTECLTLYDEIILNLDDLFDQY